MTRRAPFLLVAEDDDNDFLLMQSALAESPALRAERVRNGQELLDFLIRSAPPWPRPYAILLDLHMPVMDGLEVLRRLKTSPCLRAVPVVVFSGAAEPAEIDAAYALGANSFIKKGVSWKEFQSALRIFRRFWLDTAVLPVCLPRGVEPAGAGAN